VSLRGRLLATSLATLVVGLGALLVAGNVLLAQRVRVESSSVLRARVEAEAASVAVTPRGVTLRAVPGGARLERQSWVLDGSRVVARPAGVTPALDRTAIAMGSAHRVLERVGPQETRLRAQPLFAAGSRQPRGAVVVGASVEPLELLQREVLLGSLVVAALVLLAGGATIRAAVDGALRPVAQMTTSAEQWGAHDLDRRFGLGPPRDELTGLAGTLDHLLARIAASRRHEQRFASEVAHELRTPLARLRGRSELALTARGPGAGGERDAALRAVIDQVDQLDRAVDALLAVARQDEGRARDVVDLAELAREFDEVEVSAPIDLPPAEGDADVIRRALAPLVENARRHARRRITLDLDATDDRVQVLVRDDGPGVDPALGSRVFEPGVRSADAPDGGAGLGLPLARRLARSCGGDVVLGDGPGGCFALLLPAVGPPEPHPPVR
jgi:signal transduction histidine kinase